MSHCSAGGEGGPAAPGSVPEARGATGGNGSGGGGGAGGAGTVGLVGPSAPSPPCSADTFLARGSDATWSRESIVHVSKRGNLVCLEEVHHEQFVIEYKHK